MSAREALAEAIRYGRGEDASTRPTEQDLTVADAVIAEGYYKPRSVTTTEELEALPVGTVVLSTGYTSDMDGNPTSFQRMYDGEWHRGGRSRCTHPDNIIPATVIHEVSSDD